MIVLSWPTMWLARTKRQRLNEIREKEFEVFLWYRYPVYGVPCTMSSIICTPCPNHTAPSTLSYISLLPGWCNIDSISPNIRPPANPTFPIPVNFFASSPLAPLPNRTLLASTDLSLLSFLRRSIVCVLGILQITPSLVCRKLNRILLNFILQFLNQY